MLKIYLWRLATAYAAAYLVKAFIDADGSWIVHVFDWNGFERFFLLWIMLSIAFSVALIFKDTREAPFK